VAASDGETLAASVAALVGGADVVAADGAATDTAGADTAAADAAWLAAGWLAGALVGAELEHPVIASTRPTTANPRGDGTVTIRSPPRCSSLGDRTTRAAWPG